MDEPRNVLFSGVAGIGGFIVGVVGSLLLFQLILLNLLAGVAVSIWVITWVHRRLVDRSDTQGPI